MCVFTHSLCRASVGCVAPCLSPPSLRPGEGPVPSPCSRARTFTHASTITHTGNLLHSHTQAPWDASPPATGQKQRRHVYIHRELARSASSQLLDSDVRKIAPIGARPYIADRSKRMPLAFAVCVWVCVCVVRAACVFHRMMTTVACARRCRLKSNSSWLSLTGC